MTYQLTPGPEVVRLVDGAIIPTDADNLDRAEYEAWLAGGGVPLPVALPALTEADYQRAIEAHVDAVAQGRRYSSAAACASYVTSGEAIWAAEAAAFVAWRDEVYRQAFAALALVLAGQAEPPTIEGFLASLPTIEWPEAAAL